MSSTPIDSPLRRSDARVSRIPLQTPNVSTMNNDDEEERRNRRSNASTTSPEESLNVKMYLQMFNENKITKENVWNMSLIDNFLSLLNRHHKDVASFQVAGTTLEASTKVYALRVDSLHYDAFKMAQSLSRHSAKSLNRDDNADDESFADDGDNQNENATQVNDQQPGKKKRKKQRRNISTVTKNKESLNEKLDTVPFTDPFFAQLNSIVGDINSSSRLMQNLLPTKDGVMLLDMHYPYWDKSDKPEMVYDENDNFEDCQIVEVEMPELLETDAFHHTLKGYKLTDKPAEDDSYDLDISGSQLRSANTSLNHPAAMIFDPEAEVAPVHDNDGMILDLGADAGFDDPDDDFAEQLSHEDMQTIQGCRGLQRQPVIIEDMRPVDNQSGHLEYSYRPLEHISQFWAGPSHWKYRKLRSSTKRSLNLAGTESRESAASAAGAVAQKVTRPRRKKTFEPDTGADMLQFTSDKFLERNSANLPKRITLTRSYVARNWNQKKLRLPTNLELDHGMYDNFSLKPGLSLTKQEPDVQPEIPVEAGYNYDNPQDREYCSQQVETDAETDTEFGDNGGGDADQINTSEENIPPEAAAIDKTIDVIPLNYEGAPEKVAKIEIPYAKLAKPVDMKQLKAGTWRVIKDIAHQSTASQQQPESEPMDVDGEEARSQPRAITTFSEICKKIPNVVTPKCAESMSTSLIFYSLLHLCNERGVDIQQQADLYDLTILAPPNVDQNRDSEQNKK